LDWIGLNILSALNIKGSIKKISKIMEFGIYVIQSLLLEIEPHLDLSNLKGKTVTKMLNYLAVAE
jgi:hypothetical protein